MRSRAFETVDGLHLIVKNRKSAVILEIEGEKAKHFQYWLGFTPKVFEEFKQHIKDIAHQSWPGLTPKEANSLGADYGEYYDREFDNNGYLSIKPDGLLVERPSLESQRFYQFNKKKMEPFLYDLNK